MKLTATTYNGVTTPVVEITEDFSVRQDSFFLNYTDGDQLIAFHQPFGNFSKCVAVAYGKLNNVQDFLDFLCDNNALDGYKVAEVTGEEEEDCVRLGNAGELFDLELSPGCFQVIKNESSFELTEFLNMGEISHSTILELSNARPGYDTLPKLLSRYACELA